MSHEENIPTDKPESEEDFSIDELAQSAINELEDIPVGVTEGCQQKWESLFARYSTNVTNAEFDMAVHNIHMNSFDNIDLIQYIVPDNLRSGNVSYDAENPVPVQEKVVNFACVQDFAPNANESDEATISNKGDGVETVNDKISLHVACTEIQNPNLERILEEADNTKEDEEKDDETLMECEKMFGRKGSDDDEEDEEGAEEEEEKEEGHGEDEEELENYESEEEAEEEFLPELDRTDYVSEWIQSSVFELEASTEDAFKTIPSSSAGVDPNAPPGYPRLENANPEPEQNNLGAAASDRPPTKPVVDFALQMEILERSLDDALINDTYAPTDPNLPEPESWHNMASLENILNVQNILCSPANSFVNCPHESLGFFAGIPIADPPINKSENERLALAGVPESAELFVPGLISPLPITEERAISQMDVDVSPTKIGGPPSANAGDEGDSNSFQRMRQPFCDFSYIYSQHNAQTDSENNVHNKTDWRLRKIESCVDNKVNLQPAVILEKDLGCSVKKSLEEISANHAVSSVDVAVNDNATGFEKTAMEATTLKSGGKAEGGRFPSPVAGTSLSFAGIFQTMSRKKRCHSPLETSPTKCARKSEIDGLCLPFGGLPEELPRKVHFESCFFPSGLENNYTSHKKHESSLAFSSNKGNATADPPHVAKSTNLSATVTSADSGNCNVFFHPIKSGPSTVSDTRDSCDSVIRKERDAEKLRSVHSVHRQRLKQVPIIPDHMRVKLYQTNWDKFPKLSNGASPLEYVSSSDSD